MGLGGEYLCPAQRVVVTCYNIVTESHYCLKLFSTHSIKHLIARINALLEMVKKDNDLSISWTSVIPWPKATQRRTGLLPGDVVPSACRELLVLPRVKGSISAIGFLPQMVPPLKRSARSESAPPTL